jgi:hypothetical protein
LGSIPRRSSTKTAFLNDFDDLFTDVNAVALTTEEAQAVEGDGRFGAIVGVAIGSFVAVKVDPAIANAIANSSMVNKTTLRKRKI